MVDGGLKFLDDGDDGVDVVVAGFAHRAADGPQLLQFGLLGAGQFVDAQAQPFASLLQHVVGWGGRGGGEDGVDDGAWGEAFVDVVAFAPVADVDGELVAVAPGVEVDEVELAAAGACGEVDDDAAVGVDGGHVAAGAGAPVVAVFGVGVHGELAGDLPPRIRQVGARLQVGDVADAVVFDDPVQGAGVFEGVVDDDLFDVVADEGDAVGFDRRPVGVDVAGQVVEDFGCAAEVDLFGEGV